MANVKVSNLPELGSGSLDAAADFVLVSDGSAVLSKKIKPAEMVKGALATAEPCWDFAAGSLASSITFTRASTGWRYNSAGVLVPETTNVARFQYDPATLAPRGLLIEEAETNDFSRSAEIDNAYWSKLQVSIVADAVVSPDGTTTMDRMIEDVSAAQGHYIRRTTLYVAGTTYAASFFAKAGARTWVWLDFPSAPFTTLQRTYFDLVNGVVGTTGPNTTAYMQHVGGGIYHCTIIATATVSTSGFMQLGLAPSDGGAIYTGDGVSDAYFWGLQISAVSSVQSHVPTTTAAVTRANDVALITNSLVLTDRCWVIRGRTPRRVSSSSTPTIFQVDDGSETNRLLIRYADGGTLNAIATVGGTTQCNMATAVVAANTDFTIAVRWADNNFAVSLNGGAIITDTVGTVPASLTAARIGRGFSTGYWNSTIKSIETRRTATDAELPLLAS